MMLRVKLVMEMLKQSPVWCQSQRTKLRLKMQMLRLNQPPMRRRQRMTFRVKRKMESPLF
jgi:hypothetical protein